MKGYQMGLVEEIEWEKLMALPSKPGILHEYYVNLKKQQHKNKQATLSMAMKLYVDQWKASMPHDRMLKVFSAS